MEDKPGNQPDAMVGQSFTRRRFLAGAGYLAGGVVLAGALDACGTSGTSGMPLLLTDSPRLFPVPAIDRNAVVLTPDSPYANWAAMFDTNAAKLDYLLTPGDYRGWGPLEFLNRAGNTQARPKTVRYHNPGVDDTLHPVQRYPVQPSNSAQVDSLKFESQGTTNWLVHGLTVISPTVNPGLSLGANNITVDFCLIECARIHSFRIRHATHCTIQRCVIRDAINKTVESGCSDNTGEGDSSGIQVGKINADLNCNISADEFCIKILDNEIYNVGDAIQLTHDDDNPMANVEVLIEGNDLYLEQSRYIDDTQTTWDENAIDIKAGSDRPESTIIRNNRMWGYRRNAAPTALGEILVVHMYCRNVLVEDNIMGDAPRGMSDRNWPPSDPPFAVDTPRNITFRNNQFYEIRDYAIGLDEGAITRPITACISFVDNYFARSAYLVDVSPLAHGCSDPVYTGNILVEVDKIQRGGLEDQMPYDPALNTVATAPHGYDTYERKRWTGPEFAIGAVPRTG